MLDQPRGAETQSTAVASDPTTLLAASAGVARFEHHPLFPREDASPETRDIQFVSFYRRRTGDQATQNCPEDIPASDIKSWAQVVEWWGGGEYKAIAKDGKHRMVAWFPHATGDWLTFDGDSKPFTLRNGKAYRAHATSTASSSADAALRASTPAPEGQEGLLGVMTQVLHELRAARTPVTAPATDGALVAMIQAQTAQATATNQGNAQIMQTLLSALVQRPTESATRAEEPTSLALQLIGAVQKLVPTPAAAPGLAEQIPLIKALRDLYQPAAAAAPANELQPFVDIFGQVMAADAARTQAERAQTSTKLQEAPAPRPPPRPRPQLVHVPGIGMVEVVAPDATTMRVAETTLEERAAAIRKDPALLRELGLGLAPSPVAPLVAAVQVAPSPALPVAPAIPAVRPVIPAFPDLEPPPAAVSTAAPPAAPSTVVSRPSEAATVAATLPEPEDVTATSPVAPSTVVSRPSEAATVAAAPPEPEDVAAASPESPAPLAEPAGPSFLVERPHDSPPHDANERTPIALPERMPTEEPLGALADERELAMSELTRLTSLTHEARTAALRKLPGIGAMAEDVARVMAELPADAVMAMAASLTGEAIGALARGASGGG